MILIICADNRLGLRFNHRRQSRDRAIYKRILEITSGARIIMKPESISLFPDHGQTRFIISDNPLSEAKQGDYCFYEDTVGSGYMNQIEALILFRWNRTYAADCFLDIDTSSMQQVSVEDFEGFSHNILTMEVYRP